MQAKNQKQELALNQFQQEYRILFQENDKWKKYLDENGFVVIKNYLDRNLCQQYMNEVWQIIEKLSLGKIQRNDKQSQKNAINYPPNSHGGLIQYIGHARFQWQLRKRTKKIFQKVWGVQNVKTSFDGLCFSNGIQKFEYKAENEGLHVDQPPIKNKLWSYQGLIALTDAGNQGGGFVCVPKSNKYFVEYFKERKMECRITAYNIPQQNRYKQPLSNYIKVNMQAGDFLLFDSRTFHCGSVPISQSLRVVTYICMMPDEMIPPLTKQMRMKAFKQRLNSGHHCGDGFRTFSKIPRRASKEKQYLMKFQKMINEINQLDKEDLQKDEQILTLI